MAAQLLDDLEFLLKPSIFYYFSVSVHVSFFIVLSVVWLCRRYKVERSKEKVENSNFLYHKLTFFTSLCLGLFYLLFFLIGLCSKSDFLFKLDSGIRSIFWFLFSCYVQFEFGRLREKKFPVLFRVMFGLFLLVSIYSVVRHLLSLQKHAIVEARLWVFDFGSVLTALLLNYAGLFGKQTGRGPDSFLQEPLLNETSQSSGSGTGSISKNASLYTNVGFFSFLTFSWVSPLLSLGYKKTLNHDDIPVIDEKDSINGVLPIFKAKLDCQMGESGRVTALKLAKALFFTCFKETVIVAFYEIVRNLSSYVGPYLIRSFVDYLYLDGTKRSNKQGYLLVFAFIIAKVFECLSRRHLNFQLQQVRIRLQAALVGTIYQKGLTLSSQSRQSRTIGEMINIMSVDVSRVSSFTSYIHDAWLVPVQVGLALTILYSSLGRASLFALVATVLFMLVNIPLSRMEEKFQESMMKAKDIRMKAMSEVLRNMHTLKLQGWEMKFLQKICNLRNTETRWIKKLYYVNTGLMAFLWGMPTFVAVVTFGACIIMGIPLSTSKVLSALATFELLQGPIYSLPDTITMVIQMRVSLDRISSFLCLGELPNDAVHRAPKESSDIAVEVQDCNFSWDPESEIPTLKELNFSALHGMRVAVCGTVGSGKSSLLSCILGEMPKLSGVVKLCGSTAYVSQSPWIQSGKIEDNILFGTEMNRDRYDKVLEVCSLNKDLEKLPHGDQTIIGERGINLSGGQKQRIQIARALYQDADIFLFDDPFSALDAHTGSHVFKECLMGFLASKTVIYVTHQVEFLPAADLILVMKEGKVATSGIYKEILESSKEFIELVGAHKDALSAIDSISLKELDASSSNQKISDKGTSLEEAEAKGQLIEEEEREKGKVGFWVYWKYMTMAYKGVLVLLVVLAQISFQVIEMSSNYWMAWATPASEDMTPPVSTTTLISVFVALSFGSTLCILAMTLLIVTAGYKTATILFEKMHSSLFRAPMSFFDSTPSGRILNRVSADQSQVDLSLPNLLGYYAFTIIQLLAIIAIMSQVAWQVFIVFLPVTALCIWYQRYYIETARELSRLVGVYRAPIIQQFAESITGSTTIRSFGKELDFKKRNGKLMDDYSRPNFYRGATMEWLSLRLQVLSTLTFAICLVYLVIMPAGAIDPGFAGVCVTYGLYLNMLQSSVIQLFSTLEISMISVERILQYSDIPSEPPLSTQDDLTLDNSWPRLGEIMLENVQLRYAPQLPFVLRGLSCTFPGGMKTGIVGRTGAGKTTLIQALFRIVDPTVGQILIDNVNIGTIGLHDLRSRLSIIPQDPTMFAGTIRNNLDPLEEYTDAQIWEALDCCQLGDEVRKKELKLNTPVTENGENWSMGQRQLVCLGRVILKKSKILVLDEATASVDTATDSLIQKTLRENFSDSTVITIAHRITSVLDSDMILLLDNGIAVENDTPSRLLEDKSSLFSQLVLEYRTRSA